MRSETMKRAVGHACCFLAAVLLLSGCGERGKSEAQQKTAGQRESSTPAAEAKAVAARVRAVAKLTNPEDFARIVREAKDRESRLAALDRLTDQALLADLVSNGADVEAREQAMAKLTNAVLLAKLEPWVKPQAAEAVNDPALLESLATRAWLVPIRKAAVEKATDERLLTQVALSDDSASVRKSAVIKLADSTVLSAIATNDPVWYVRQAAVEKIDDPTLLGMIACADPDAAVSRTVLARLTNETAKLDVALRGAFADVRLRALDALRSESILAEFVQRTSDPSLQAQVYDRMSKATRARASVAPWVEAGAVRDVSDPVLLGTLAQKAALPAVRKAAVEKVADQALLERIALTDANEDVRQASAQRIESQAHLKAVLEKGAVELRPIVIKKIQDQALLLATISNTNELISVREAATEALQDESACMTLVDDARLPDGIRAAAARKVHDQEFLARVRRVEGNWGVNNAIDRNLTNATVLARIEPWIKVAATKNVSDPALLERIAFEGKDWGVREAAVENLSDKAALARLAVDTNSPPHVRKAAVGRVDDPAIIKSLAASTNTPEMVRVGAIAKVNDQSLLETIAGQAGADPDIRVAAIGRVSDRSLLATLAQSTNNPSSVRLAAVNRIDDPDVLVRVAIADRESNVRDAASARISDENARVLIKPWKDAVATRALTDQALLARISREGHSDEVRKAAVGQLTDPAMLAEVALKDSDKDVREAAVRRVTDPTVLAEIGKKDTSDANRRLAVEQISDPSVLEAIAHSEASSNVCMAIVERLTNQVLLAEWARTKTDAALRDASFARLTDPDLRKEATPWVRPEAVRKIADPVALARLASEAGSREVRVAAMGQLAGTTNQAPEVAYEWISHLLLKNGKRDDAMLAMLMATVASVRDSSKNIDLSLATFERANELRTQSALQSGLSALKAEAGSGGKIMLADLAGVIHSAQQGPLQCREEQLVSNISGELREILRTSKGAPRGEFFINFNDEPTTPVHYAAGDLPFLAAAGLAELQRPEDWPYIEKFLASDPFQPKFAGYLLAMARDKAFEQNLLSHPSAMVRANALIALGKPAPSGEQDLLVRCAGAWNPVENGTNAALRLLEGALDDERHVVRVMALRGLARHGVELPLDTIQRAMTNSAEWRKRFTLGCMVWTITSAADPSIANRQFTSAGSEPSDAAIDCGLLQAGYAMAANRPTLSRETFAWLLGEMKLKPDEGYPAFYLSRGTECDGYRIEYAASLSAEQMNAQLASLLAPRASEHADLISKALRGADPYGRMVLLQATDRVATNQTIREMLWRIAESGTNTEQRAYRDKLYSDKVAEVQKGLMWNQYVNYSAVGEYADKMSGMVWRQGRRLAVNQLAATATDPAEYDRLASLIADEQTARAALLILLSRDRECMLRHASEPLLHHEQPEVRMCAAIARLAAEDTSVARGVLAKAIEGDDDRAAFAARVALHTRSPAWTEVVRSARNIKSVSVAGYLIRRLQLADGGIHAAP